MAVKLHDLGDVVDARIIGRAVVRLAELAALVPQAAPHGHVELASVQKLDLALALSFLPVRDDPDVGPDAGVVEHLLGQGDDGFEPVVLDDPLADVAFAGAGAAGE